MKKKGKCKTESNLFVSYEGFFFTAYNNSQTPVTLTFGENKVTLMPKTQVTMTNCQEGKDER